MDMTKLKFWTLKKTIYLLIVFSVKFAYAQNTLNKYGLAIYASSKSLELQIQADSNKRFVNLKDHIPDIVLDIKYASTQNVFYEQLYPKAYALLRYPAAEALKKVQFELRSKGYGLKIYDAYRPYSVTCRMWDILPDSIYMGLPRTGSKHNRGISLDLTLIDLQSNREVKMPTPFDALVYASHPSFTLLPEDIIRNRDFLINTMSKYGFKVDPVEWWHFNYISDIEFELLDIPHEEIIKTIN
jgi:D-alanyl-D-alanine dipeptidase